MCGTVKPVLQDTLRQSAANNEQQPGGYPMPHQPQVGYQPPTPGSYQPPPPPGGYHPPPPPGGYMPPGGYPPPGPYGGYPPGYGMREPGKSKAVAGLVLGVVAMFIGAPFINVIIAVVGFVLVYMSYKEGYTGALRNGALIVLCLGALSAISTTVSVLFAPWGFFGIWWRFLSW